VDVKRLMAIAEAKARLDAVLDELAEAGFPVWSWDESFRSGSLRLGPGCISRIS